MWPMHAHAYVVITPIKAMIKIAAVGCPRPSRGIRILASLDITILIYNITTNQCRTHGMANNYTHTKFAYQESTPLAIDPCIPFG